MGQRQRDMSWRACCLPVALGSLGLWNRARAPCIFSLTQVSEMSWSVGNRGATDVSLSWCRLFALCLLLLLVSKVQGEGSTAQDKKTSWAMQTLQV